MRTKITSAVMGIVFLIFCTVPVVQAQTTGSVFGIVKDETGAPIDAAKVTVQQEGTVNAWETYTDIKGRYLFPNLAPARYKFTVEAEGYSPMTRPNINVRLGSKITLDFTVRQAIEVSEEVLVTAPAPPIETTKVAVDQNISFEQFKDIPTQGRDFNTIINTFAGVTKFNNNFNVMGSRENQNNFLIDGMKNNELGDTQTSGYGGFARALYGYAPRTGAEEAEEHIQSNPGTALSQINLDAIEEVQVSKAGYSTEYGQGSGGVFNLVTRSGTDQYKFGFTVNHQTDKINAETENPYPMKRWQESVFLGGPLIEGKLRFFASYERDDYYLGFDDRTITPGNLNLWVRDFDEWRSEQGVNRLTGKFTYIASGENKYNFTLNFYDDGSKYRNTQWRPDENFELRNGKNRGLSILAHNQRQFSNGLLTLAAKFSRHDQDVFSELPGDNLELRPSVYDFGWWIQRVGTLGPELDVDINSLQLKSTYNLFLKDKAGDHNLLFGIDFEYYRQKTVRPEWNYVAFWNYKNGVATTPDQDEWYLWFVQTAPEANYTLPLSQGSVFINEEWNATDKLTINAGVRGDWDEFIDKIFFSPRIGFAMDPFGDGKTVIRGGAGVFRDRSDLIAFARRQYDRNYNTYFQGDAGPFKGNPESMKTWKTQWDKNTGSTALGTIYDTADDIQPPMTWEANIGFERDLVKGFVFRANYFYKKMDKLFYEKRYNYFSVFDGTTWVKPFPSEPTVFTLENSGYMSAHDIEFVLTKNFANGSFFNISYVWEDTRGNSSRAMAFWFETYFNQTGDQEQFFDFNYPADFEVKHYFKASWSFTLPLDIIFSGFMQYRTGKPFHVYAQVNYPAGWALVEPPNSRRLNPFRTIDIRLSKRFTIGKNRFQVYIDVFNLENRDNILSINGSQTSTQFLEPLSYGRPRQAQIGFRWEFN